MEFFKRGKSESIKQNPPQSPFFKGWKANPTPKLYLKENQAPLFETGRLAKGRGLIFRAIHPNHKTQVADAAHDIGEMDTVVHANT